MSCVKLKDISIGEGVQKIEGSAFNNCRALTKLVIPSSVTSIEDNAFTDCKNLKSIHFDGGIDSVQLGYNVFGNDKKLFKDEYLIIDGNLLKYIGKGESITIPDEVTRIRPFAFEGLSSVKEITLSDSINIIDDKAFYHLPNLETINVQCSAKLSEKQFDNCDLILKSLFKK